MNRQQLEYVVQKVASEEVLHYGLSIQDISKLLQNLIDQMELNIPGGGVIKVDVGYLHTWAMDDLPYITKEINLIRDGYEWVLEQFNGVIRAVLRNPRQVAWHKKLERWCNDQTVIIQGREIKPFEIVRSFDKIPNIAMNMFAASMVGEDDVTNFFFGSIGDGGLGTQPTPADVQLIHEIDRVNANESPQGGASTVDGSTFQCVANFSKALDSFDASESGVHDKLDPPGDRLVDHTIFSKAVPHVVDNDAPGISSVIFQCST